LKINRLQWNNSPLYFVLMYNSKYMADLFKILLSAIAAPILLVVAFVVMRYTFAIIGVDFGLIISITIALTPIWLPFVLFFLLFERWMDFVHLKFSLDNGRTTLRIKLPQEVLKSPEAMESVFALIHNPNNSDNLWQTYIDGRLPLIFSFELVSIGGDVRFYINIPTKKTKNLIEAQLYAQFPGIEVTEEMVDYSSEVVWNPKKWEMMVFHIGKKEDQVFPVKTYIDFGLDKQPKEELKFEPMAAMLEQLSTAKPHERFWIQILCKPHVKRNFKSGFLKSKASWEGDVFAKISEMLGRDPKKKTGPVEFEEQPRLTAGERDTVAAMERNAGKYAYETAIRYVYITPLGKFDGNALLLLKTFSQYDIIKRNGLGVRWRTDFDYNWFSDWSGRKKMELKKKELEDYKKRVYTVREPISRVDELKIFTAEELATIYHIPGSSVITPGLSRIPSARREAPANLPVELPQ